MYRKAILLTAFLVVASVSLALTATPIPELLPGADDAPAELSESQTSLLEAASDPTTEKLSEEQIARLKNDPEIQNTGWGCCLGDCWEAWGVCMDTCAGEDVACRNACRAERDACIDDCGQPGI